MSLGSPKRNDDHEHDLLCDVIREIGRIYRDFAHILNVNSCRMSKKRAYDPVCFKLANKSKELEAPTFGLTTRP